MRKSTALVALAALGLFAGLMPEAGATAATAQDNVRLIKTVPGSTGGHVAVDGNRLYVGAYGLGMRIFDVTVPANPVEIGHYFPGPQSTSDPGLRADTVPDALVMDGRHIASLNGTSRAAASQQTEFLDVTDPANPKLLWRFTGANDGESHNGDIVDSRRLWLPSGGRGNNLIRIYDLNPLLQTPAAAPAKIFGGNINTLWLNSPYRAAAGKPAGVNPSHIHDLEVYADYNLLLLPDKWVDQDGDGVADPTYAKRDIALYAASQDYPLTVGAGGAPNSAVYIVDITNAAQPVVINKVQARPGHRYLHEVQFLQGDPHVMFTSDEDLHNGCDAGGVYSWRLSEDLTDATFLDSWFNGTGTPAALCSAHVFSSNGPYVFMGSYQAGLQVIDFSDPADLKRAGQYIAPGANYWGALYHKGVIYAGDFGARGLDVLEFIANPVAKGRVLPNPATVVLAGANEILCDPTAPTVDGLMVQIPEDKRDGTHIFRAVGAGTVYDLNVYFYDEGCGLMEPYMDGSTADEQGPILEGAAYAFVDNFAGEPVLAYAQIDP